MFRLTNAAFKNANVNVAVVIFVDNKDHHSLRP